MKEIGGYIQLDTYTGEMLHEEGILLNSGRNCLLYLAEAKHINKIRLPYFLCDSVYNSCVNAGIKVKFYHVDMNFMPEEPQKLDDDEWLYIVDYYGQLSDECIASLKQKYNRIVLDYTQSYFRKPLNGVDTMYTCRKFLVSQMEQCYILIPSWSVNLKQMNRIREWNSCLDVMSVQHPIFT